MWLQLFLVMFVLTFLRPGPGLSFNYRVVTALLWPLYWPAHFVMWLDRLEERAVEAARLQDSQNIPLTVSPDTESDRAA